MSRTNTEKIKHRKLELIHKHGARCMNNGCRKDFSNLPEPLQLKNLQLHHSDGNESNHKPANLKKLFCASCHKKHHPGRLITALKNKQSSIDYIHIHTHSKKPPVTNIELRLIAQSKNLWGNPKFRKWLFNKLYREKYLPLDGPDGVIDSGAAVGNVLCPTIREWLKPIVSAEGECEIFELGGVKYIRLKPKYKKEKHYIKKYCE